MPVQSINCYDVAPNERLMHIDGLRFLLPRVQSNVVLPQAQIPPSYLLPCDATTYMASEITLPEKLGLFYKIKDKRECCATPYFKNSYTEDKYGFRYV